MNSTTAIINLNNLKYNFKTIRRKTKTKVMAVVKADAYGHGMLECVSALSSLNNRPDYYGVALISEALELRNSKIVSEPILCFAPFSVEDIPIYQKKKIIPSVTSKEQVEKIFKIRLEKKVRIHININTGMNRLGINVSDSSYLIHKLINSNNVIIDGIYTHFATSDEKDKSFAHLQLNRFLMVLENLKSSNINYGLAHTSNSGAILDLPESYLDMVRPGISLYGYYPSLETTESLKLKPVMSLTSKISTVSLLEKDEYVGYGRLFKSQHQMYTGTIPIGYADGLLRALSGKINVIIADKLFPQIGRVSMDRISINFDTTKTKIGSKVILLGKSKKNIITAWDWAKILNTIPYEITCGISKRIPRNYVGKI